MDTSLLAGLGVAATAATFLNVGKGVQKMKVEVLKKGRRAFDREHRRDLFIWFVGFLMTTVATGLFSYALKLTDKAGLVSATGGLGIVGLVLFARFVLGERFGAREAIGTAGVVLGTVLIGYFDQPVPPDATYPLGRLLVVDAIIAGALGLGCALSWRSGKAHSLTFGATAGMLIAISIVFGDLALLRAGNSFLGQLTNPFPYVAITVGTGALVVTQFAFFRGRAMVVVPTINSFIIAGPPLIEYVVRGTTLAALQLVGLAVIVVGVVILTSAPQADGAAAPAQPRSG